MSESKLKILMDTLPQVGKVDWIGIRPQKRGAVKAVSEVMISVEEGLEGDHYQGTSRKRQVTLIQAEHLATVESILKKEIDPSLARRNIVVSGINLLSLKDKQFTIGGEAVFEYTGLCHPCSRMETNLGYGGYNAMRGHGGITARVLRAGKLSIGDDVSVYIKNFSK